MDAQDYLKENIKLAVDFLGFQKHVGREKPDVMT
jgi:phosphoglucomutase